MKVEKFLMDLVQVRGSHKPEKKSGTDTLQAAEPLHTVNDGPMYLKKRHKFE